MKKVERKEINKDLGNVKGLFKGIIVILWKALLTLVKNILYILYLIIYNFDNLMAKLFMKLPRLIKVVLVYGLLILLFIGFNRNNTKVIEKNIIEEEKEVIEEKVEDNEEIVENNICYLESEIECKIFDKALENEMTVEQALLLIAISKHETGNWTSDAFINKNNFGGLMQNSKIKTFETQEDGLNAFVSLLKNRYFGQGLNTIEEIGNVYCPVGASNDKKGLNQYWIPNVTKYYNDYMSK